MDTFNYRYKTKMKSWGNFIPILTSRSQQACVKIQLEVSGMYNVQTNGQAGTFIVLSIKHGSLYAKKD